MAQGYNRILERMKFLEEDESDQENQPIEISLQTPSPSHSTKNTPPSSSEQNIFKNSKRQLSDHSPKNHQNEKKNNKRKYSDDDEKKNNGKKKKMSDERKKKNGEKKKKKEKEKKKMDKKYLMEDKDIYDDDDVLDDKTSKLLLKKNEREAINNLFVPQRRKIGPSSYNLQRKSDIEDDSVDDVNRRKKEKIVDTSLSAVEKLAFQAQAAQAAIYRANMISLPPRKTPTIEINIQQLREKAEQNTIIREENLYQLLKKNELKESCQLQGKDPSSDVVELVLSDSSESDSDLEKKYDLSVFKEKKKTQQASQTLVEPNSVTLEPNIQAVSESISDPIEPTQKQDKDIVPSNDSSIPSPIQSQTNIDDQPLTFNDKLDEMIYKIAKSKSEPSEKLPSKTTPSHTPPKEKKDNQVASPSGLKLHYECSLNPDIVDEPPITNESPQEKKDKQDGNKNEGKEDDSNKEDSESDSEERFKCLLDDDNEEGFDDPKDRPEVIYHINKSASPPMHPTPITPQATEPDTNKKRRLQLIYEDAPKARCYNKRVKALLEKLSIETPKPVKERYYESSESEYENSSESEEDEEDEEVPLTDKRKEIFKEKQSIQTRWKKTTLLESTNFTPSVASATQDYVNEMLADNQSSLGIDLPHETFDDPLLHIRKSLSKTTYFNQKNIRSHLKDLYQKDQEQSQAPKASPAKSSLSNFLTKTTPPKE